MRKMKIYSFAVITLFFLLTISNTVFTLAQENISTDGNTFKLEKDDPIQYGAFLPPPNYYSTMSIDGSNQGDFSIMNWASNLPEINRQTVGIPGKDISNMYPWYFENYLLDTTTNNNYSDPWDTEWVNVSAFNAENETISSFNLKHVWIEYSMSETSSLEFPLNSSIPIQINIRINSRGPKLLKFQWLTEFNSNPPNIMNSKIISPSGKNIDKFGRTIQLINKLPGGVETYELNPFNYWGFVAHEAGTYKLLIFANHDDPARMLLEFMNYNSQSISLDSVIYGGSEKEIPNWEDIEQAEWQSQWFRFSGTKGEFYELDLSLIYNLDFFGDGNPPVLPNVDVFVPCENGYQLIPASFSNQYIYCPSDGDIFVTVNADEYYTINRYSLFIKNLPMINYEIGNTRTFKFSKDSVKSLSFTVQNNSFVRFNFTQYGSGLPSILSNFRFIDSKSQNCFSSITPLDTKIVSNKSFYYYYMPAGNYRAYMGNTNFEGNGILQMSSKIIGFINDTIPINNLGYNNKDPTNFKTINFEPDDYYKTLKKASWIGINITDPGQYKINVTLFASENSDALISTLDPSHVLVYNNTDPGSYEEWTDETLDTGLSFPAFSTDGDAETGDILFVAYPMKWHDFEFTLDTNGIALGSLELKPIIWNGEKWEDISIVSDETNFLRTDGKVELNLTDSAFKHWDLGAGFDLLDIDETNFYWLGFNISEGSYIQVPEIQQLKLSNTTLIGDLNLALVGESGYIHSDYWDIPLGNNPRSLIVNLLPGYENDSTDLWIMRQNEPYIVGVEEGYYKLLMIPVNWSYSGSINLKIAVSNYKNWNPHNLYNITSEPIIHPFEIINGDLKEPYEYNYQNYPFGLTDTYNKTVITWKNNGLNESYYVIDCYGKAYSWTQLITSIQNVTSYTVYIMQELPWINGGGPNMEIRNLATSFIGNNTYEFGVLNDKFTLIFKLNPSLGFDLIPIKIGLSQYNTLVHRIKSPKPSSPSIPWINLPLLLGMLGLITVMSSVIHQRKIKSY
jgi:hypothetical protein